MRLLNNLKIAIALSGLLAISSVSAAQAQAIDVTDFTLPNGMEVVVIPDHRAPVVTHMVWYKAGSADEMPGKSGVAHFFEHLMFKGTKKYPDGTFDNLIRSNGAENNAFTSKDFTAYYERVAKDRLPLMMELEADRMQNLVLTEDVVATELQVVLEERRMRVDNDPSSILAEQTDAALYLAHPYGRPTIGWKNEVSNLTLKDAVDFYRANYTPSNAILIVSGDVTVPEVKRLAERYYAPLKNTFMAKPRARLAEPQALAARRLVMRDARVASPVFQRTYLAAASAKAVGNEDAALDLLGAILGDGTNSMLYQTLITRDKLASVVGASYSGDALDVGTFSIYAMPVSGGSIEGVEKAVDAVLAQIVNTGVTADALRLARARRQSDFVYLLDSQESMANVIGQALTTGQKVGDLTTYLAKIDAVTPEEIRAAAKSVLDDRSSVTSILLPASNAAQTASAEASAPAVPGPAAQLVK